MTLRRILMLSVGALGLSFAAWADSPPVKAVPAVKLVPAVKSDEKQQSEADKRAEAAKKQQDEIQKLIKQQQEERKKALEAAEKQSTHTTMKTLDIKAGAGISLQTLSVDGEGRVLALVAPPRSFGAPTKNAVSEIHVFDKDGEAKGVWKVPFGGSAVNAGPDGTVYVAGSGKLAKFDKTGKSIGEPVELAFIADLLKNSDALKAKAEKQVKDQKDNLKRIVDQYKDRIAKIKEKKEEDRTKTEVAQLKQAEQVLESYKQTEQYYAQMTVESVLESMLSRLKIISSVAVNEKDMYIVCGESEGYGFSVWRMDLDMKNPKKVLANVSGCCGQMDVQCCSNDIIVAENTRHRFAKYDRDGKELVTGGKRGKETEQGCFGGCCNPMNVRSCGGDVLTAESEGIIKKFSSTGEFMTIVGTVNISGGCKNVAIAATKDESRIYFCDQPGGKVIILKKK